MVHGGMDGFHRHQACATDVSLQVGAIHGYDNANGKALDLWESIYPNVLLLALTDTFSTEAFYKVRETYGLSH